ncbi:M15 family metallopeptidase [Mucilaginibacter psychrotolerans]|uniref:M15 family metallopeptidase n=1 Tax=Mucilaginibacter psychrotolerans TaxID=1524096 RepID=UPI00195CB095|nr:M15 family metallopeptidase [Mucilaginibacter psychrotolerans]
MSKLTLIKLGSKGAEVEAWQDFLIGLHLLGAPSDGDFGPKTLAATIKFQADHGLNPEGVVGNRTYGVALQLDFNGVQDPRPGVEGANWPPKPAFPPLVTNADRQAVFGTFTYVPAPLPGDPEHIRVTDNWAKENIKSVPIPQLKKINGESHIEFHKLGAAQLTSLWAAWEAAGLLHWILRWDGSYNPRFVRKSHTTLSNHAFGSAFDINEPWNGFGKQPALVGQKGCVRELVAIANENGFYWGGHFNSPDGMHFELAKIL